MDADGSRADHDRNEGGPSRAARARAASVRRRVAGAATAAALVCGAGDARADFDIQFGTSFNGGWMRRTPTFSSKSLETNARVFGAGRVPTDRSLALVGPSLDVELTLDDRWRVPIIGGATYWAAGSYDRVVTSLDGSIASVRPWSAFRADLLLPGIGRRWKHRRNMWGVSLRSGVSFMQMGGSVASAAESDALELSAATFVLQAEIEACRRLDPTTRICLQVAPRLYEHELMNGLTFGIRMEWGR